MRASEGVEVAVCQMYNRPQPLLSTNLLAGYNIRHALQWVFGTRSILSDVMFLACTAIVHGTSWRPHATGGFLNVPLMYHNVLRVQVLKVQRGHCPNSPM